MAKTASGSFALLTSIEAAECAIEPEGEGD
jgi:hypothetical protein